MITRQELTGGGVAGDPERDRARGLVTTATARLTVLVETAVAGRTVDGWLGPEGLVWHVAGDPDAVREAVVLPGGHLAATVARMVVLGRRADAPSDVTVPVDDLRALLHGGPPVPGLTAVRRVWTVRCEQPDGSGAGFTVVDQGEEGALYAVAATDGCVVTLTPVTPLAVWLRLAALGA
jgi:hypothetical protein